jgi:hypothetical protein
MLGIGEQAENARWIYQHRAWVFQTKLAFLRRYFKETWLPHPAFELDCRAGDNLAIQKKVERNACEFSS